MSIKYNQKISFHRYIYPNIYHPHLKHSFPFTTHIFLFTTHTRWFCMGYLQEYSAQKIPDSRSYQSHTTYTICIRPT